MAFQTTNVTADWSELPFDLLCRIATDHVSNIKDFVMGSCVCRSWYYAFSMVKEIWNANGRRMPWLMLAEPSIDSTTTDDSNKGRRKLFDPSEDKCYNLKLPETFARRCWGTDHGWVVTLGLDLEMHLFNPLTKVRQSLPSQRTFLHRDEEDEGSYEYIRNRFIHQVRVFKMPLDDNDHLQYPMQYQYVVMAIHGELNWLSYAKVGDPSWMPIDTTTEKGMFVLDVAYCNGSIIMLCLGPSMVLNVVDGDCFYGSSKPLRAKDFLQPLTMLTMFPEPTFSMFNIFESFGDLLLVARYKIEEELDDNDIYFCRETKFDRVFWFYKTKKFQVFKLDFNAKQWKEVKDIGDRALFIGANSCISVQASNAVNCSRNTIYFGDDEEEEWNHASGSAGHDMGVYSIEHQSIRPVYEGDDTHSRFCAPFWFMPKLN